MTSNHSKNTGSDKTIIKFLQRKTNQIHLLVHFSTHKDTVNTH